MTYQERAAELCEKCGQSEVCGYYIRDMQHKCEYLQNVMYGWELGQEDTLDTVESFVSNGNSEWTDNFMEGLKETLKGG